MTVRWGIAGTGAVASSFVEAMSMVPDGDIVAVASRDQDRADAFAAEHSIPNGYGDYEALALDASVDVVYIATPHHRHHPDTLLYLQAGKHVLCEKPLALNASQALEMTAAAGAKNVFLMEAIWSRFLPAYQVLADVLSEARIGTPLVVEADFGFPARFDPTSRYFDRSLGGGALLDLGIYPLQLCSLVFGAPDRVSATGIVGVTGVDDAVAATLGHPGHGIGVVKASIRAFLACTARISGTEGWIEIPALMHCPDRITVCGSGGPEEIEAAFGRGGFRFEISEVHRCLAEGRLESRAIPHSESVTLATTMDRIRSDIGVTYPGE